MEALLTAATIFLAIYTYKLWDATNGLLISDEAKSIQAAKDMTESLRLTRQAADAASSSVIVAAEQAKAAAKSASVSETAYISNQRALVGPTNASMASEPTKSKDAEVAIEYRDFGKEPATNFTYTADMFIAPENFFTSTLNGEANNRITSQMLACMKSQTSEGNIVYPTMTNGYNLYVTLDKKWIADSVITGDKIILAQGCFIYKTMGKIHHSYFCYFFKNGSTKPANLNICPIGQYAN